MSEQPPFPLNPPAFDGHSRVTEAGACFDWLRQGWAIFIANPGVWLGMTLVFLVLLLAPSIVPLVGQLATWLLAPILAAGMLAACRRSAEGEEPAIPDLFTGFQRNTNGLVVVGALNVAGMLAILLFLALLGGGSLAGGLVFGSAAPSLGIGVALGGLMLVGLLAVILSTPLLMALWFAPALVLFHAMPPVEALKASFNACLKNWLSFAVFGLLLSILVFFAVLPLGLGFLVLIPVMFGALYASYRDIFVGI